MGQFWLGGFGSTKIWLKLLYLLKGYAQKLLFGDEAHNVSSCCVQTLMFGEELHRVSSQLLLTIVWESERECENSSEETSKESFRL